MTGRRYAEGTVVSVSKSIEDIRKHLDRFGAKGFIHIEHPDSGETFIGFSLDGRSYKIGLPMDRDNPRETRRLWRVLEAYLKALLFGAQEGIGTAHDVLLPYLMLPNGRTMREEAAQNITHLLETGQLPGLSQVALGPRNE